jgi:CHAT domain-containing protein
VLEADNRFVREKYSVRYVASGRDLIRENRSTRSAANSLFVFANPNFGSFAGVVSKPASNAVAMRSIDLRELKNISLPSLHGTEKEAAELRQRAQRHGWQENVALGSDASEAQLRRIKSPRILHLATHGFFLPENQPTESSNGSQGGKVLNPMLRSGIALAGAQKTLRAWARGETPPADNDGIVTAEEVGGLKLDATWLVVLSACDTGSGEARAGEGVIGLRRGFIQAGAQNLLMTLWPISDETTVQIMLDFYDAAFKSGNAPQALADTERDWLVKLRKERGLLPAVQLAGPFIMSSQGQP